MNLTFKNYIMALLLYAKEIKICKYNLNVYNGKKNNIKGEK